MALELHWWAERGATLSCFYGTNSGDILKALGKRTGVVFATTTSEDQQGEGEELLKAGFELVARKCYVNPNSGNHIHLWMKQIGKPQPLGATIGYPNLACCGAGLYFQDKRRVNSPYLEVTAMPTAHRTLERHTFLTLPDRKFVHNFSRLKSAKRCPHYK